MHRRTFLATGAALAVPAAPPPASAVPAVVTFPSVPLKPCRYMTLFLGDQLLTIDLEAPESGDIHVMEHVPLEDAGCGILVDERVASLAGEFRITVEVTDR